MVYERSAVASSSCEPSLAWSRSLSALPVDLAAFEAVEVKERGKLWRELPAPALAPATVLAELGRLEPRAVVEVRARTRSGARMTLHRRSPLAAANGAEGWQELVTRVHLLAPRLEALEVQEPGATAPRALFAASDARRLADARRALDRAARGGEVSVVATLLGRGGPPRRPRPTGR